MKMLNPINQFLEPRMNTNGYGPKKKIAYISVHSRLSILLTLLFVSCSGTSIANETNIANMLYWSNSNPSNETAAFRYKVLLYTDDGTGIRAETENMGTLYGAAEQNRAQAAEDQLRIELTNNPTNLLLQNMLLDLYYDRMAAELVLVGNALSSVDRMRMEPPSIPSGLVIDDEINLYEEVLDGYRSALTGYFPFLSGGLGLTNAPPAGYKIFHQLVPIRGMEPATYLDGTNVVSVTGSPDMLFKGYKDLVMLFNGLRDYGRVAVTLANLQAGRNNSGDYDQVKSLITNSQRFLFLQSSRLLGMFPRLDTHDATSVDATSGLTEALDGVSECLTDLETIGQSIRGDSNLLGFEDDFLMLIQKFAGQSEDIFDSFDAFELRLDPENLSSPLRYAMTLQDSAIKSYDIYSGYQSQLESQLDNITGSAEDRLFQICGAYPSSPEYETPENNEGCEIWLQLNSIEVARLQIEKNCQEMTNLLAEIEIERARSTSVSNTTISYGNKQSDLTQWIGHINAAQQASAALARASSVVTWGVSAVDAVIQAAGEEAKGQLEAKKERLAAQEKAKIEGFNSAAKVETLSLGILTLHIDSQGASVLLTQEMGIFTSLLREKEDLERTLAESDSSLAGRWFADPIHHLRNQHQTMLANLSFDEAQKWLFFMTRALEYKWNTPFMNYYYLGRKWSAGTLFKLRNAQELQEYYNAMASFNSLVQLPSDDYFDWFSVKEDFLGYYEFDETGTNILYYADPSDPDAPATLTALDAFRSYLRSKQDAIGNIKLTFSTRREIAGGTFYRGARRDDYDNVLSAGLFLDKIKWLKISLPGTHSLGRSQLAGELSYGGTGFIRNFDVGSFHPTRPDRLQDEETTYSTRYWYFHAPSAKWRFSEALSSPVTMQLSADPRVPPTVSEIDIFKERSVATTGWDLTVPTEDLGVPVMNIDELDDIELYFYHYAVSRQMPEGASATAMSAMVEGQQTTTQDIPFPYYLKYHPSPEEGGK